MPIVSIVFGVLLVGLGAWGYSVSDLPSNVKWTALIPAAFGAILVVCGVIGMAERFLKHAMHAAAMVGLIGLLLAVGRFVSVAANPEKGIDLSKPAQQATLAMMGLCLVFVGLCVNSFIQARKRRRAREAAGQPTP
jgi:glucose uptake protein GlcU